MGASVARTSPELIKAIVSKAIAQYFILSANLSVIPTLAEQSTFYSAISLTPAGIISCYAMANLNGLINDVRPRRGASSLDLSLLNPALIIHLLSKFDSELDWLSVVLFVLTINQQSGAVFWCDVS